MLGAISSSGWAAPPFSVTPMPTFLDLPAISVYYFRILQVCDGLVGYRLSELSERCQMEKYVIPISAIVGRVLAEQRKAMNIPQAALAEHMGMAQVTWSRIERGLAPLEVGHLFFAAALLGLEPAAVLQAATDRVAQYQASGHQVVYLRPKDERLGLGKVLLGAAGVAGVVMALSSGGEDGDD